MAKKQTRRSVSIKGTTYQRIREHCERVGLSMSEFVEARISSYFDTGREPVVPMPRPTPPPRPMPKKKSPTDEKMSSDEMQKAARIFTF